MKKILALALIGSAVWWFWGRTLEPARVIHAHLEAIGKHDYTAAYAFLSDEARTRMTPDEFREAVQANPIVDNNYTGDFLDRTMGPNSATFNGTVRALGGEKTSATFVVVKQQDRWVIQDFRFPSTR